MKAIKKIKKFLIHKLGGLTNEEAVEGVIMVSKLMICGTLKMTKIYADTLYGLPAEEWCKKMYQYFEEQIKEYEDGKEK